MPAAVLVLAELAALFFAVVGYLAARGTLAIWEHSIGGLLQWMHDHLNIRVPLPHFGSITIPMGRPFGAANNYMVHLLQDAAAQSERSMGIFLHGLGAMLTWTLETIEATINDGVRWSRWAQDVLFPTLIHAATHPLATALRALHVTTRQTAREAHAAARVARAVPRTAEHAANRAVHRAAIALPRPVTWPQFRRSWAEIKAWQHVTAKRLLRLEALLAASGLALAVANLTGTRVGCWRGGGNIARMLRHVCGVPAWLLDLLIVGAVEAFIVSDLCRFTDLLIREAEAFRPTLMELVDVEDALIGCHGASKPLTFKLPPLSLSKMPEPSPLAA